MSQVEIRDATDADVEAILRISNAAIAETTANWDVVPETAEQRRAWLHERQGHALPVLVATEDGVVVGFASYGPFRSRAGYANTVEHSVYLDSSGQGRGTGTSLMEALIERARKDGVHVMVGGIDGANAGSIRFHERLGFTATTALHEVGRKFDRWLDLVFVHKVVSERPGDSSPGPSTTS